MTHIPVRYCERVQAEHQQWVDLQVQKVCSGAMGLTCLVIDVCMRQVKNITLSNSPRDTLKIQSDHAVPPVGSYDIPDMIGQAQKQVLPCGGE